MTPEDRYAERDARLERLVRRGDDVAVLEACRGMVGHEARAFRFPGATRDDVLQEANIAVLEASRSWAPGGAPFGQFARFVVRRRLMDALTASRRHGRAVLTDARRLEAPLGHGHDADTLGEVLAGPGADPVDTVIQRDELRQVLAAIPGLTDVERSAVVGRAIVGESYRATAARAGVRPKSIDNALQRARAKLRAEVGRPRR